MIAVLAEGRKLSGGFHTCVMKEFRRSYRSGVAPLYVFRHISDAVHKNAPPKCPLAVLCFVTNTHACKRCTKEREQLRQTRNEQQIQCLKALIKLPLIFVLQPRQRLPVLLAKYFIQVIIRLTSAPFFFIFRHLTTSAVFVLKLFMYQSVQFIQDIHAVTACISVILYFLKYLPFQPH